MASLLLTGCVETVDGRHRAGVPFMTDRIEGSYNRSATEVMAAARDVLKQQGSLTSEDNVRNSLQGVVEKANIWMAVTPVEKGSRLVVQARRNGVPDLELAAHLEKSVGIRLASGAR
jgi:hypothetical protein